MKTLAIMPTYLRTEDDLKLTAQAIRTLKATSDATLLVVDDGSPEREIVEGVADVCEEERCWFLPKDENEGFSATVNVGLKHALESGHDALLVNADMEFINNDWLSVMERNPADVVGALLLYPNLLVQHAGIYYSVIMRWFDHRYKMAPRTLAQVAEPQICPVTGALQLIKHDTLERVGLYDEGYRLGYEDVDYCHMVFKAGMVCAYEPRAQALHHEGMFRMKSPSKKHQEWMEQSWHHLHEKHAGHDFSTYTPTMLDWPDDPS